MATLMIRNLPEETKLKFRARAAAKGLSMEEAARRLITASVSDAAKPPRKSIGQMIYEGSRPGVELPEVPDSPASYATFDE